MFFLFSYFKIWLATELVVDAFVDKSTSNSVSYILNFSLEPPVLLVSAIAKFVLQTATHTLIKQVYNVTSTLKNWDVQVIRATC